MPMKAREFVDRLGAIKASVKSGETPGLAEALHRLQHRLKDSYEPEALKAAIQDGTEVPTGLEEDMTTLTMEWMRQRGASHE